MDALRSFAVSVLLIFTSFLAIDFTETLAADAGEEAGFVSIFNGNSLDGWEGKPGFRIPLRHT